MRQAPKIATCCYCGTRAALVLSGQTRHELACSAGGAPLHNLKQLPKNHVVDRGRAGPQRRRPEMAPKSVRRRVKRRKGLGGRFLEEAFDLIEDILD